MVAANAARSKTLEAKVDMYHDCLKMLSLNGKRGFAIDDESPGLCLGLFLSLKKVCRDCTGIIHCHVET
jgi:hypothetical protein